ncbi:histidine kinase [Nostoc sp. 3335mG]|nr:histidine kinase [Nostoc sp. 3335mG]
MTFDLSEKNGPWLYGLLALLLAGVFAIDLNVPLGTAVWVIYLVPTVLAYLAWRPQVPLLVAVFVTTLVAVGFFIDRPGIDPDVARLNRIMGVVTVWVLAMTGFFFIRNKLMVKSQEWLQTGQVHLARHMSGEISLAELGQQVTSFLADYFGARAAVFFAREGDGFSRVASFGVPPDAAIQSHFRAGEGLLGEVARTGRSLTLTDIPADHLVYGTALGRGVPSRILAVPTFEDETVNGVIEFGFVGEMPEDAAELLERIAGAVGIAVRSVQYRARLAELLEETRKQAEELRAHTEELSTANEELEEQSRALLESQKRLELQQAELEQTNTQLEEQTQLLEAQRDDLARTQGTLREQARQLESASRYKSEFVANMSHELRTPLNALLIMARLLADNRGGNLSSEQVSFAQTIESSGNDLLALINDILDISKIEAGKLDIQPARLRVKGLLDKLGATFMPLAEQKGLDFSLTISPEAAEAIETDAQRLEQVLKNFLSNAIKFTERGAVSLSVAPAAGGRLAFSVRDTGIGIAIEQQDVIFEAFRQADGTINRKYGGTGLGLSISRELSHLLGGQIEIDSAPGKGSTFTLVLPTVFTPPAADALAPRPAPAAESRETTDRPRSKHEPRPAPRVAPQIDDDRDSISALDRAILVVEDDLAFARILVDLAHELGFKCILAHTADDGVLAARQYLPQAIILDIGLPDHSGLSVLDRLKRDVRTRHIPVHVASVEDYSQVAKAYGAMSYMLKPVKRERLVTALEQLETQLAHNMRRVLIVEDDPVQLEGLKLLLAGKDVETLGVSTAADCLDLLKGETFDCMVLDMTLPDASGFDVLEQLDGDHAFSFPPVIVYTARELSDEEELRLRKYSKSIIIKGAKSPERLIDEVTLFLHQVVSELPEPKQRMVVSSLNRDSLLEGRKILVVEDDVRNVFAVTSIFEPHGAEVEIARNGREALDALDRMASGASRPADLVLMDVMMPEMDGLTATREIRTREQWKKLPVIMLTAKAMADDQDQCLAAGANDYLAKPLDVDKLLSLTRVWMPR